MTGEFSFVDRSTPILSPSTFQIMVLQFRNGSIPRIHAIADIKVDQHNKWNAVSIDLLINRLRTIVILLPPISEREGGNDLFRAKPITGLIHSFMDKNGEHITALPTFQIQSFN